MSITLETKSDEQEFSNGEWLAITMVGVAFGILEKPWNCCHDRVELLTSDQLLRISDRLEQLGRSAGAIKMMGLAGGITSAR